MTRNLIAVILIAQFFQRQFLKLSVIIKRMRRIRFQTNCRISGNKQNLEMEASNFTTLRINAFLLRNI